MSGIEAAGLTLGIISAIISIIDATHQVYEAVKDEAGLPTNFKKSATKLPLISKLLEDAERYVTAAEEATETAFTPTLEDCKAQATQLQELFAKVMPEDGESRWDRYVKAARTIGKGGRVEDLVKGILDGLQLLTTKFPEVTTARSKDQLAKAVEEVTKMEPSLPNGFEQMPAYAHYGSGAQNNNTGSGIQHINSGSGNQNSGSGHQYISTNHIVYNHTLRTIDSTDSQRNIHFTVPRTSNSLFTGRTELLSRIQTVFSDDNTSAKQKRFVITGLGGQGKSEICLQVANLMKDDFWGIFWVDVNKPFAAERDFIAVAKLLRHSAKTVPEALQALATTQRSWLLILDNADDLAFDYQVYFPPGHHGAVLMTSRVSECRRYSPDAFQALEGLEEEDSKHLLLKAAEIAQESWPAYDRQAEEVVNLLGSHTLALIQAGAYISQNHCYLSQYPEVYKRQRQRLLKYGSKQAKPRYLNVYATFEASADVLERFEQSGSESATDALRLLEIMSILGPSALPFQIFEEAWKGCKEVSKASNEARDIDEFSRDSVLYLPSFINSEEDEWDPFRLTEASALLASLSLIARHNLDGGMTLSIHPLTHAWAKDRQDFKRQGVVWITTGCVLGFSFLNTRFWQTQEGDLLPHILSFLDLKVKEAFDLSSETMIISIFFQCGIALSSMRQDTRLGQLLQDIFLELRQSPGTPSEEFLPLYDLYAKSLIKLGESKRAVMLLEQVVKIKETTLPELHLDRLASQHTLAGAYRTNGQIDKAVVILEKVGQMHGVLLLETHPDRLASQHELAEAYQAIGQVGKATVILENVVRIEEKILPKTHPSRLASQFALAGAYRANKQVGKAIVLLEKVVQIREATLPGTHLSRLASQHALAGAYRANGQVGKALPILEKVVQMYKITLPETHPSYLSSQHTLAGVYRANGQIGNAIIILEEVVRIRKTTQPETHPSQLASQHELAIAYQANKQISKAVAMLQKVVEIKRRTLLSGHPSRVASEETLSYFLSLL